MTHYPLEGVVIVDLTQIYNGPYATYLLALAGATVIKIEPPGGESLRRRGVVGGAALPFAMLNGAKKSICLDLKSNWASVPCLILSPAPMYWSRISRPERWTGLGLAMRISRP